MAKANPSVVLVRVGGTRERTVDIREAEAGGVVFAGAKLTIDFSTTPPTATTSDGGATDFMAPLYIALEKEYDDANTSDAIDATYASGEVVRYIAPLKGDQVYVLASSEAIGITIDDYIADGGATVVGTFKTNVVPAGLTPDATTVVGSIYGRALETVALSTRFLMEVF